LECVKLEETDFIEVDGMNVFGPLSEPDDEYIKIPPTCKTEFIQNIEDLSKAECLFEAEYVLNII
jgi:hypothetical protein